MSKSANSTKNITNIKINNEKTNNTHILIFGITISSLSSILCFIPRMLTLSINNPEPFMLCLISVEFMVALVASVSSMLPILVQFIYRLLFNDPICSQSTRSSMIAKLVGILTISIIDLVYLLEIRPSLNVNSVMPLYSIKLMFLNITYLISICNGYNGEVFNNILTYVMIFLFSAGEILSTTNAYTSISTSIYLSILIVRLVIQISYILIFSKQIFDWLQRIISNIKSVSNIDLLSISYTILIMSVLYITSILNLAFSYNTEFVSFTYLCPIIYIICINLNDVIMNHKESINRVIYI